MILFLVSCGSDPLDVDVSDVSLEIGYERFETELAKGNSPEELKVINADLLERGGELYQFYIYDVLSTIEATDDSIGQYLWYFQSDKYIQDLNDDIQSTFGEMTDLQDRFTDMFKHLKYHLPNAPLPKQIITYNSAFRYGVLSTEDRIGIGLDMYLGEENRNVKQIGFPVYMKAKMNQDYLPVDVAHSWIMTNILGEEVGESFLSAMIYYGKLRYLIDAMMPDMEDHIKMRYTKDEYDFALASEWDVWQLLVDMDWVYSTELKVIMRFFDDAPTTVGIDGSPDRLGQFMGWQIVRQYMDKNPDVSIEDLIYHTEESKILKAYKPIEE